MWTLEYVREISKDDFNYYPVRQNITKTYDFKTKDLLKIYVSEIMSVQLDDCKNPIEPTIEIVKKYNLYSNSQDKIDGILKFFKKNYERYLDIIKESNDFEKEEYTYNISEQADYYYLDTIYSTNNEKLIKSFIKITKKQEVQNGM